MKNGKFHFGFGYYSAVSLWFIRDGGGAIDDDPDDDPFEDQPRFEKMKGGDNVRENKNFKRMGDQRGLKPKNRRNLHDELHKGEPLDNIDDIGDLADDFFGGKK